MATIKIKGKNDDIWIPQRDAIVLKQKMESGEKGVVTAGRYTGPISNISGVFLEEGQKKYEGHNMEDYQKARAEMLALPTDERVKKQANLYKLVCYIFRVHPDAIQKKADIEICRNWMKEHPYRMWFDIGIWIKNWNPTGKVGDEYQASTINMLGRMVAIDAAEEQDKLQEITSLTKAP